MCRAANDILLATKRTQRHTFDIAKTCPLSLYLSFSSIEIHSAAELPVQYHGRIVRHQTGIMIVDHLTLYRDNYDPCDKLIFCPCNEREKDITIKLSAILGLVLS